MRTIAFQQRSEELAQKQPELHEDTYVRLRKFEYKQDGFTLANIVNEAVAQFLGVGDLARIQERVEDRLKEKGVSLPPGSQEELEKKINRVAEGETEFHKVFNVCSVANWQNSRDRFEPFELKLGNKEIGEETSEVENLKIHFNTSHDIWESVAEAPGYRSYVVNTAVEWWFDSPFSGSCDHVRSLHQLLAAAEGDNVKYEEATEWVQWRMDGIRKESDGKHLAEWEALFDDSESGIVGMEWKDIRIHNDIEVEESAAVEAMKSGKLRETWKNRIGVLAAVLRNKPTPEEGWSREDVEPINDRVNSDMGDKTKRRYVDKTLEHFNDDKVQFGVIAHPEREDETPISEIPEVDEFAPNHIAMMNQIQMSLDKVFEMGHRKDRYDLTEKEAKRIDEYAAQLVRMAPEEVFEVGDGNLVNWLNSLSGNKMPRSSAAAAINSQTPASV